jgi:hypothetical protein
MIAMGRSICKASIYYILSCFFPFIAAVADINNNYSLGYIDKDCKTKIITS